MRVKKLTPLLLLGGAGYLWFRRSRRQTLPELSADWPDAPVEPDAATVGDRDPMAVDPNDLVQGFEEASDLELDELDLDAMTVEDAEAAEDLAEVEADIDETATQVDEDSLGIDESDSPQTYEDPRAARGSGELYDVHVVDAVDRELPDDDRSFDEGEHWLEHLEASSGEYGPTPEHVLDIVDESDPHDQTHSTDTRDIPIADRGSAGPRGL
ncbi:MAG: hypothetical protein ACTHU0_26270 [Kofleriaceae bacterium]